MTKNKGFIKNKSNKPKHIGIIDRIFGKRVPVSINLLEDYIVTTGTIPTPNTASRSGLHLPITISRKAYNKYLEIKSKNGNTIENSR